MHNHVRLVKARGVSLTDAAYLLLPPFNSTLASTLVGLA
jgi:hypothetical protein